MSKIVIGAGIVELIAIYGFALFALWAVLSRLDTIIELLKAAG